MQHNPTESSTGFMPELDDDINNVINKEVDAEKNLRKAYEETISEVISNPSVFAVLMHTYYSRFHDNEFRLDDEVQIVADPVYRFVHAAIDYNDVAGWYSNEDAHPEPNLTEAIGVLTTDEKKVVIQNLEKVKNAVIGVVKQGEHAFDEPDESKIENVFNQIVEALR